VDEAEGEGDGAGEEGGDGEAGGVAREIDQGDVIWLEPVVILVGVAVVVAVVVVVTVKGVLVVVVVVAVVVVAVVVVIVLVVVTVVVVVVVIVASVAAASVVVVVMAVAGPLRCPLPLPTGKQGCRGLSCRARSKHASTVSLIKRMCRKHHMRVLRRERAARVAHMLWDAMVFFMRVVCGVSGGRVCGKYHLRKCTTRLAGS
jgi:hypothetical protein